MAYIRGACVGCDEIGSLRWMLLSDLLLHETSHLYLRDCTLTDETEAAVSDSQTAVDWNR